jgi:hypothetical protein
LIARPTAQTAPVRRSIQITISSRVPSSLTAWTTRSAKRVLAESGPTPQGYNPPVAGFFSRLFGKGEKREESRASMTKEDSLAAYVIREHRGGRSLEDILDDPYLKNRASEEQRLRLLERPDVIRAVGEDVANTAAEHVRETS